MRVTRPYERERERPGYEDMGSGDYIAVVAATWNDFAFDDEPATADTDDVNFNAATSTVARRLLVWQQDDETENGIWTFHPERPEGSRWERMRLEGKTRRVVLARWGTRFGGVHFMWVKPNVFQPLFPARFRVDIGSNAEGESISGLAEMVCGETPSAGDIVYLRHSPGPGIYIALADDWVQIGQPAPRTPDLSALDGIGYFDSDVFHVLSKADAEATECLFVTHEAAISPSALTDEPEE